MSTAIVLSTDTVANTKPNLKNTSLPQPTVWPVYIIAAIKAMFLKCLQWSAGCTSGYNKKVQPDF